MFLHIALLYFVINSYAIANLQMRDCVRARP